MSVSVRPGTKVPATVLSAVLVSIVLAVPRAGAIDTLSLPVLPVSAGQGGSGPATSTGFESLFGNPAAFRAAPGDGPEAAEPGEVTLLSLSSWYEGALPWDGDIEGAMLAEAASGGLRYGGTIGVGYVGGGLGLGAALSGGAEIGGDALLSGLAELELGLVGGYSYALDLLGLQFRVGAAVRPLLHIAVPLDDSAARRVIRESATGGLGVFRALWLEDALFGFALAVDMGAILDLNRLHLGLLFSDVGDTAIHYSQSRFGDVVTSLASFSSLPEGSSTDQGLTIPMTVRIGAEYVLVKGLTLRGEIMDPAGVVAGDRTLLDSLHAGVEIALGAGRGWLGYEALGLSAGASFRVGPLETSFALYGADSGSDPFSFGGVCAEAAIRF